MANEIQFLLLDETVLAKNLNKFDQCWKTFVFPGSNIWAFDYGTYGPPDDWGSHSERDWRGYLRPKLQAQGQSGSSKL